MCSHRQAIWTDISKRPDLTVADYDLFIDRIDRTMEHFEGLYSNRFLRSNKFFSGVRMIRLLTFRRKKSGELSGAEYSTMKEVATKFIRHIKRAFAKDLVDAVKTKTSLQDAETLLAYSSKLTYRWAAGIIASNHIANMLIKLSPVKCRDDDIMQLYTNLKNRTVNEKLKNFLTRSYRRFEDAHKVRNRCAHVIHGEPMKQEIEQSIGLARLLQKYVGKG